MIAFILTFYWYLFVGLYKLTVLAARSVIALVRNIRQRRAKRRPQLAETGLSHATPTAPIPIPRRVAAPSGRIDRNYPWGPRRQRERWRVLLRQWWAVPLLSFGVLSPLMVAYAAYRLRSRLAWASLPVYIVFYVFALGWTDSFGIYFAIIGLWLGATAHCGLMALRYSRTPQGSLAPAEIEVHLRLAARERAREIVQSNPAYALELGIGHPELHRGYDDGGLVDLNHVPAAVLGTELRLSQHVVDQIQEHRRTKGPFLAVDELALATDLSPGELAPIRDRILITVDESDGPFWQSVS